MKSPEKKRKYRGVGFAGQAAVLAFAVVCCLGMCCSFTHAWFITERGVSENQVELATYGVTVYDAEGNELDEPEYLCPLAPEDLHYFTLEAEGTAYTGHCVVEVTNPDAETESYVIELEPDRAGMVSLQAAKGSLLTFSFDWGDGEEPEEPANAFGREDTLLFHIEHSRTPHLLYEVAYGASPAGIAAHYDVSVKDLCVYNDLDADAANLPVYPGQGEKLTYEIPYPDLKEEELPVIAPYVPKGDLVVSLKSEGDAATPDDAYIVVTGPDRYEAWIWHEDFVRGSYRLENLTAGEYELTMCDVKRDNYELETTGELIAQVHENGETEHAFVNTYTRHVGDLILRLKPSDADVEIPADAKVILRGPDDTYEIPYDWFNNGSILREDLPTGTYDVVLTGAEVKNYDLIKAETTLVVNRDETTETKLTAEYKRQVGDMEIVITAEGHDIPEDAVVTLYGPDDVYEIPYEDFKHDCFNTEEIPTGEYIVRLKSADVDGYDLTGNEADIVVEKGKTADVDLSVEYKRHQGNVEIRVTTEGHVIPEDALVVLVDENDVRYEVSYEDFKEGRFTMKKIPTGEYTVEVVDADVSGYDLTMKTQDVVVEKGKTAETEITATYKRQVGDLTIVVEVGGADLPAGALLTIVGADGYNASVACENCTLSDLPTGEYTVRAEAVELDGYEVVVTKGVAKVTKTGVVVHVSVTYTVIESVPDEDTAQTS